MKNIIFFIIVLLAVACNKTEEPIIPTQVGVWEVEEQKMNYKNDSLTLNISNSFNVRLDADNSGIISNAASNTEDINWLVDIEDNKVFIIRTFGSFTVANNYNILINENDNQQWKEVINSNDINGNTIRNETLWDLTRIE